MKSTMMENTLICQPQNVNPSGRVFGGFLMHRAYDLAQATCYTFAGVHPKFKGVAEVSFKKPVDIGDLVRLKSRVVFTSDDPVDPIAHIEVTCQVVRPEKASSFVSNTFDFLMGFHGDCVNLRRVLPTTREEAERLVEVAMKESTWKS
jgi:acyl-coenzyme A thioesterase 9